MLYLCFHYNLNFFSMAKYIKQEMINLQGKGENKSYYKMQTKIKVQL